MGAKDHWVVKLLDQTLAGRYRIERLIGMGGMGAVFQATHVQMGRIVAVKILPPRLVGDPDATKRFQREARAASALGGGGVVEILDLDVDPVHGPFLAMEFLQGESLSTRIVRLGRLEPAEAVALMIPVADTLAAVHTQGIVHRDLKPGNVFLAAGEDGGEVVKILDFGVVRLIRSEFHTKLTRPGMVLGTPSYMPPEQVRGDSDVDHRADIYAAGAILYVCLSGRRPYDGPPNQVLAAVATGPPAPLATVHPGLPEPLYGIVDTAMAHDRARRFPDAGAMAAALRAVRGSLAPAAGRRAPLAPSLPAGPPAASRVHGSETLPAGPSTVAAAPPCVPVPPSRPPSAPALQPRKSPLAGWGMVAVTAGAIGVVVLGLVVGRLSRGGGPPPAPADENAAAEGASPVEPGAAEARRAGVRAAPAAAVAGTAVPERSGEAGAGPAPAPAVDFPRARTGGVAVSLEDARRFAAGGDPLGALGAYVAVLQRIALNGPPVGPETSRILGEATLDLLDIEMKLADSRRAQVPSSHAIDVILLPTTDAHHLNVISLGSNLLRSPDPELRQCAYVYLATLSERQGAAVATAETGGMLPEIRSQFAQAVAATAEAASRGYVSAVEAVPGGQGRCGAEAAAGLARLER